MAIHKGFKWEYDIMSVAAGLIFPAKTGRLMLSFFVTKENDRSVMNIRDNGIGMKSSEIQRAFEKSFTGTNGRAGKASTGMAVTSRERRALA